MMKKILLLISLLLCMSPAFAQVPERVAEGVAKAVTTPILPELPTALVATTRAAEEASHAAAQAATAGDVTAEAATAQTSALMRFATNHQHELVSLQTIVGISARQAVMNLRNAGVAYVPHKRMPISLPKHIAAVNSLTGLEVAEGSFPALPVRAVPSKMYRGIALPSDGAALRNILENGLLLKDVGAENNQLLMGYAASVPGAQHAIKEIQHMRFTNLTNDPQTAFHYAHRNNAPDRVMVLVSVNDLPNTSLLRVDQDIPAEQIDKVFVLVNWNGTPTWARATLKDGQLYLMPYMPLP